MNAARWKPNVTVAAVIERDGRYLLVEETASHGTVLNQPAGHLEAGETLLEAVVREVLEETAHAFTPTALLGVYLAPGETTYLRFAFVGAVDGPLPGRTLDAGIVRTAWLTPEAIAAELARHRSVLVARCIADHRAGVRYPLSLLQEVG